MNPNDREAQTPPGLKPGPGTRTETRTRNQDQFKLGFYDDHTNTFRWL